MLIMVGYGDVMFIMLLGKLFFGIIIILGVGIFVFLVGILVVRLLEFSWVCRDIFCKYVLEVMEDGSLLLYELGCLNQLCEVLDLDDEQVNLFIDLVVENIC